MLVTLSERGMSSSTEQTSISSAQVTEVASNRNLGGVCCPDILELFIHGIPVESVLGPKAGRNAAIYQLAASMVKKLNMKESSTLLAFPIIS